MIFGSTLFGQYNDVNNFYFCLDRTNQTRIFSIVNDNIQFLLSHNTSFLPNRVDTGSLFAGVPNTLFYGESSGRLIDFDSVSNTLSNPSNISYSGSIFDSTFAKGANKLAFVGTGNIVIYDYVQKTIISSAKPFSFTGACVKFSYFNGNERLFIRNTSGSFGSVIELSPTNLNVIRTFDSRTSLTSSNLNNFDISQDGRFILIQDRNSIFVRRLDSVHAWTSSNALFRSFTISGSGVSVENIKFVPGTPFVLVAWKQSTVHYVSKFDISTSANSLVWQIQVASGVGFQNHRLRNLAVDQTGTFFSYSMNGNVNNTIEAKRFPIRKVSDGSLELLAASGSNSFTTAHGFIYDERTPELETPL